MFRKKARDFIPGQQWGADESGRSRPEVEEQKQEDEPRADQRGRQYGGD